MAKLRITQVISKNGETKRQIANLPKIRYSNLESLSYSASKRGKSPGTTCFPGNLSVGADRMDISQE